MASSTETALYPTLSARPIERVAILFAGGPAPAANAVISTAAASFRRSGIEVMGIMHGYAHLIDYRDDNPLKEGRDYIVLDQSNLKRTRNTRGILIGTSRTNPGKGHLTAGSPGRSRAHRPASHRASSARVAGRQCA